MAISRAESAKRDGEIIRLLNLGHNPETIARETGAGLATIYRKRKVWLQERSDAAVADLYRETVPDALEIPEPDIMNELHNILHPPPSNLVALRKIAADLETTSKRLALELSKWD